MAFETPITIREALDNIHRRRYVLPAIQRELVWSQRQITRLFDSLMRGYPIGAFLFWRVESENLGNYEFYDFMLNYHQKNRNHLERLGRSPSSHEVIAVLDGQQRLTALNIGLRGSYAQKLPRLWWRHDSAFPTKELYLNLLAESEVNEEGMRYDFRFLTDEEAQRLSETECWYRVGDILDISGGSDLLRFVRDAGLEDLDEAFDTLERLQRVVKTDPVISYYEERSQDLDKVLDVFIRTNSGGTPLSQSDLLFSIAIASWDRLDAREEIYEKVDEINDIGDGFNFSKDQLLRAGLLLAGIPSVRFRVTNFNRQNMQVLQESWRDIVAAFESAVDLVASYGYSRDNLVSHNAVLPIAYYIYHRGLQHGGLNGNQHAADRENIRLWLTRSFLKRGIWSYGLDGLLTAIRDTIKEHGDAAFPVDQLGAMMTRRGKSLEFDDEELQDIVESEARVFIILSLLFPFVDLSTSKFHVDHVFPRARFSTANLLEKGVDENDIAEMRDRSNRLPNYQLLVGPENIGKSDQAPAEWLAGQYPDEASLQAYVDRHLLGDVPVDVSGFNEWYESRRERMLGRLREILGVVAGSNDAE